MIVILSPARFYLIETEQAIDDLMHPFGCLVLF